VLYGNSVSSNYGDIRFQPIALSDALSNTYFLACNRFMLNGEYKHFISLTLQPVQSVSTFQIGDQINFKILYSGSGGGLMLCLISISMTLGTLPLLSSFVPIGVTNIVDNCDQYSLSISCLQCVQGYHL
jgi:hypothetical protein